MLVHRILSKILHLAIQTNLLVIWIWGRRDYLDYLIMKKHDCQVQRNNEGS